MIDCGVRCTLATYADTVHLLAQALLLLGAVSVAIWFLVGAVLFVRWGARRER